MTEQPGRAPAASTIGVLGACPVIPCVFVWPDGHLDEVLVPPEQQRLPVFQRAIRQPIEVRISTVPYYTDIHSRIEAFSRVGRTYSQQPIYCAPGWTLVQSVQQVDFDHRDPLQVLRADAFLTKSCERRMRQAHPGAVELDRMLEDVALDAWEPAMQPGLRRRRMHLLAAVPADDRSLRS